jgi:hypothetical protein
VSDNSKISLKPSLAATKSLNDLSLLGTKESPKFKRKNKNILFGKNSVKMRSLLLNHNKSREGPAREEAPVASLNLNAEFDHPTAESLPGWETKY